MKEETYRDRPVLRATGVSFAYGANLALHRVDLHVDPGEFVALVGPNGSGKTTLLKILLGLADPAEGRAELFGLSPRRLRRPALVGYVPQRPALATSLPATVEEIVATGRLGARTWWRRHSAEDREAVDHALETVAMTDLRSQRASRLSVGQQQRAFIARALASRPQLLVLDEPVAGVDAESQTRFREALVHHVRVHAGSVLLVTHEIASVRGALDRIVVVNRRVLYDGSLEGLSRASFGVDDLPLEGRFP